MANLFDNRLVSILVNGAIAPGAKLYWYEAGTTTPIDTFASSALDPGAKNTNPVVADANGRFPAIWLAPDNYKFVLTSATGTPSSPLSSVDNYAVSAAPPSFDTDLTDFLAGDEPLSVAQGGTGAENASDAADNLAVLKRSGGAVTGDITRTAAGTYLYNASAAMTGGATYLTPSGASDPSFAAGHWWLKY